MRKFGIRISVFLIGVLFLVLGVVICSKINLGMAPFDSMVYNASLAFGIKYGTINIIVGIAFVLIQLLILRKEFKLVGLVQFILLLYISVLIDFFMYRIFAFSFSEALSVRIPLFVLGMCLISLGIGMFMSAELYSFPLETLIALLYEKFKIRIAVSKWTIDGVSLILSLAIAVLFKLPNYNIGLGTIVLFVGIGPMINIVYEKSKAMLAKVK